MGELSIDNILTGDEIDNLFTTEDIEETSEGTQPLENKNEEEQNKETKETTEESQIDVETLFDKPESVGSGKDNQEKEGADSEKDGTSPNFYSSIANTLKAEGILLNLEDSELESVTTPEALREVMEKQVTSRLTEVQQRVNEALEVGIEPSEVKMYENTITYLNSITEDAVTEEGEKGETLRKQLIFQDFVNRGYSKDRATREVTKSLNAGSDVEDAKDALASNKEYFKDSYNSLIENAKEEEKKEQLKIEKEAEQLKKAMLETEEVFKDLKLDKATRQKAYESVVKPVYKDKETGDYLTAIQKFERENKTEFLQKLGVLFTLTDGFKDLNKLIKPSVTKQVKKGFAELETMLDGTRRTSEGALDYASGSSQDANSKSGWELDLS